MIRSISKCLTTSFAIALAVALPTAMPRIAYAEEGDEASVEEVALVEVQDEGEADEAPELMEAISADGADEVEEPLEATAADEVAEPMEPLGEDEGLELEPMGGTCGTVSWTIDSGMLKLQSGTLADWGDTSPWTGDTSIKSVVCFGVVHAPTCKNMFKGCTNLRFANLEEFDNTTAKSCTGMFEDCYSLNDLLTGTMYDYHPAGALPVNPWSGTKRWGHYLLDGETFEWDKWMEEDEIKASCSKKTTTLRSQLNIGVEGAITIQPIPNQKYTGSPITPALTITSGPYPLGESLDYDVTYKNNVSVGTATAVVKGKYLYFGEVEVPFKITLASVGKFDRVAGATALDTAAEATKKDGVFVNNRGKGVVVATSDGYWDALAASAFAGVLEGGAPVLITPSGSLAPQTRAELERLKPEWIFVMGGKAAISSETYAEIEKYAPGHTERIAGATAADTSLKIYQKPPAWTSGTVIIATSNGYWDALSIAPYAFKSKSPILLTTYDGTIGGQILSDDAFQSISTGYKSGKIGRVVIVGGKAAVSGFVDQQLNKIGFSESQVVRLSGVNALETSAKIATWEVDPAQGMGVSHMGVATIDGYWDALTGAALCGQQNSVLVLAGNTGGYTAFDAVYNSSKVVGGYVFGGKGAISEESFAYFNSK